MSLFSSVSLYDFKQRKELDVRVREVWGPSDIVHHRALVIHNSVFFIALS